MYATTMTDARLAYERLLDDIAEDARHAAFGAAGEDARRRAAYDSARPLHPGHPAYGSVDRDVLAVLADAAEESGSPGIPGLRRLLRFPRLGVFGASLVLGVAGRVPCRLCLPPLTRFDCVCCGGRLHGPALPAFTPGQWKRAMVRQVPGDATPDPAAPPTAYGYVPPDRIGIHAEGAWLLLPITAVAYDATRDAAAWSATPPTWSDLREADFRPAVPAPGRFAELNVVVSLSSGGRLLWRSRRAHRLYKIRDELRPRHDVTATIRRLPGGTGNVDDR